MGNKNQGLEEALLANMDDLGSVEIDSGDDTPQTTTTVQTGDEDQTAPDAPAAPAAPAGEDSDLSTSALA